MRSLLSSVLSIAYVVVGVVVANAHRYFAHVHSVRAVASAALAVLLWPLVLAGVDLHLH
jgi:hypothetical protein